MSKQGAGPAAFLALFAPEGPCRKLNHHHCNQMRCPCDDARTYLRTIPKETPFAVIWHGCDNKGWKDWLADVARSSFDAPWPTIALGLAKRRAEPKPDMQKCESCDEEFDPEEEGDDGYCSECHGERFTYCNVCGDVDRDGLCDHLRWSDACGDIVGAGSNEHGDNGFVAEPLHNVLVRLGLRETERLRAAIARPGKWRFLDDRWAGRHSGDRDEVLNEMRAEARDDDDREDIEVGVLWLLTLDSKTQEANAKTLGWIDAHLAARKAAIAKDRRPRRVIRDGGGRYWLDGEWTPLRHKARWMTRKRASKVREVLRRAYPGSGVHVVHVLTRAPALQKKTRRGGR